MFNFSKTFFDGKKLIVFFSGTFIFPPVEKLYLERAFCFFTKKVPNPANRTILPFKKADSNSSNTTCKTSSAFDEVMRQFLATASVKVCLFKVSDIFLSPNND